MKALIVGLLALFLFGCAPIDHVVLLGDSWMGLSVPHYEQHIVDEWCDVTLDSSLIQGGSGLQYWLDREIEIRGVLDTYPEDEVVSVVITLGGLDALNNRTAEEMQSEVDALFAIFDSYSNVEVLYLSYNDFPGEEFTAKLYNLYDALPADRGYPLYWFVNLHDKVGEVRFVDILHLRTEDYAERVNWVWGVWLKPRIACD